VGRLGQPPMIACAALLGCGVADSLDVVAGIDT
jgi:hypothetical protein